jgi:pepsin A
MYYGTVGTEEFSGALTSVHIDSEWEVTGGVSVNGKTIQQEASIITDSGTTIIFGPTQQVRSIFDVAGIKYSEYSNGITGYYSCNSPPDIGFVFGGKTFNILDSALAFKMDGGNCTASIHGTSDFGDSWLVGQAFFQGKYVDHNIDDGTMGFANLS